MFVFHKNHIFWYFILDVDLYVWDKQKVDITPILAFKGRYLEKFIGIKKKVHTKKMEAMVLRLGYSVKFLL